MIGMRYIFKSVITNQPWCKIKGVIITIEGNGPGDTSSNLSEGWFAS